MKVSEKHAFPEFLSETKDTDCEHFLICTSPGLIKDTKIY